MSVMAAMLMFGGFLVVGAIIAEFGVRTRGRSLEEISPRSAADARRGRPRCLSAGVAPPSSEAQQLGEPLGRDVGLLPAEVDGIVQWIRAQVAAAGRSAAVVGLSGGIDSATVAALAQRALGERAYGVIMPCESDPQDAEDAKLVAEALSLSYRVVDLTGVYRQLRDALALPADAPRLAMANLKPRLRMLTLYAEAGWRGALVLGTGNRSEIEIGYFTKYGDGGVDILPIANFLKREVRVLAQELGVPERIIERKPSAGLWEGQTDEGEMGMSYQELDEFLATGQGSPIVAGLVGSLSAASAHKRALPPAYPR